MTAFAIYDFTGVEPNSRFENITGDAVATTRVGRVADLSGNGWDISALDAAGRMVAELGYTDSTDYDDHRLASDAVSFSGYVAIKFREDSYTFNGNCLIARGADNSGAWLAGDRGSGEFRLYHPSSGTELTEVTTTSGDHTLELWSGSPMRYSIDGGSILDAADDWTEGLQRIVFGRNISIANRAWLGRYYRAVFWSGEPTDTERGYIQTWVDGGDNLGELLGVPTPAEVFRASFEDASGRDPLPTALLERTAARKLAGHNVICYMHPPMLAEKVIPVALEDYDKTVPGKMIWIKDDYDPLFSMGRWAQIQGRTFGANPLEVALRVRISDHPESFKEFPGDIPILTEGGQPIITEDGQSILFG